MKQTLKHTEHSHIEKNATQAEAHTPAKAKALRSHKPTTELAYALNRKGRIFLYTVKQVTFSATILQKTFSKGKVTSRHFQRKPSQTPHSTVGQTPPLDCQSRCCISSTCDGKMIHWACQTASRDCVYWGVLSASTGSGEGEGGEGVEKPITTPPTLHCDLYLIK